MDNYDLDNQEVIKLLHELLLKGDFTDQYGDMCNTTPYEEAVNVAIRSLHNRTALDNIKTQIKTLRKRIPSENTDYYTGYMSALSVVEGMIADEEIIVGGADESRSRKC